MALRVLLADESSTIKKVFQLALQDFAVEVKPVNVGLDVTAVAETFKPDIIFADVLLQKKNGYDVSLEIKQNTDLQSTPVVLMWSGFMDLDEDKMQASGADGQLEKPFDVKSLRALVQNLVPRTKEQTLSSYLSFPKLPDFEEGSKAKSADRKTSLPEKAPTSLGTPDMTPSGDWNMESFDPPPTMPNTDDEFQELSLKSNFPSHEDDDAPLIPADMDVDKELLSREDDSDGASPWEQRDLGKYAVGDDSLLTDESEPDINYVVPEETDKVRAQAPSVDDSYDLEIESPEGDGAPSGLQIDEPALASAGKVTADDSHSLKALNTQLNNDAIAEIIRTQAKDIIEEQARKVIEDAVWKVLPDLARQIVEREIQKLVDEDEVELS